MVLIKSMNYSGLYIYIISRFIKNIILLRRTLTKIYSAKYQTFSRDFMYYFNMHLTLPELL